MPSARRVALLVLTGLSKSPISMDQLGDSSLGLEDFMSFEEELKTRKARNSNKKQKPTHVTEQVRS